MREGAQAAAVRVRAVAAREGSEVAVRAAVATVVVTEEVALRAVVVRVEEVRVVATVATGRVAMATAIRAVTRVKVAAADPRTQRTRRISTSGNRLLRV